MSIPIPAGLSITADAVTDRLGSVRAEDLPDVHPRLPHRVHGATPLMARLARCALYGTEGNIMARPEGPCFAAGGLGKGWNGMVFTRDICFSGVLGLNRAFPTELRSSLRIAVNQRLALGLRVDASHVIDGVPCIIEEGGADAFMQRHGTNPFTRRTDDVLWLWCAADLAATDPEPAAAWAWIAEHGRRCFAELYDHFFVPAWGLYRGQSSFVDVGSNGYPPDFGRRTNAAYNRSLSVMAGSTNALYHRGMEVMAEACERSGDPVAAADWRRRAGALRAAFRRHLLRPDGSIAYYLDRDGTPSDRIHTLATAFAVLLGLIGGDEARRALDHHPLEWYGAPLIHPSYDDDSAYHNRSAWPFSDAFLLEARRQACGEDVDALTLAYALRSCRNERVLAEWTSAADGIARGESWQLWTLAPVIGVLMRQGVLELVPG